jgi:hypothetical protein
MYLKYQEIPGIKQSLKVLDNADTLLTCCSNHYMLYRRVNVGMTIEYSDDLRVL